MTASLKWACQSARRASLARPAPTHSFHTCRSGSRAGTVPSTLSAGRVVSLSIVTSLSGVKPGVKPGVKGGRCSALDGAEAQPGLPVPLQAHERDDQRHDREQRRRQDEVLQQLAVARGGGELVPLVDADRERV